jgi:hypothetical protein
LHLPKLIHFVVEIGLNLVVKVNSADLLAEPRLASSETWKCHKPTAHSGLNCSANSRVALCFRFQFEAQRRCVIADRQSIALFGSVCGCGCGPGSSLNLVKISAQINIKSPLSPAEAFTARIGICCRFIAPTKCKWAGMGPGPGHDRRPRKDPPREANGEPSGNVKLSHKIENSALRVHATWLASAGLCAECRAAVIAER